MAVISKLSKWEMDYMLKKAEMQKRDDKPKNTKMLSNAFFAAAGENTKNALILRHISGILKTAEQHLERSVLKRFRNDPI